MTRWTAVAALGIWLLGLGPSVGEAQTRRRQPAGDSGGNRHLVPHAAVRLHHDGLSVAG